MMYSLLPKELSLDDFVDADESCRLETLLADPNSDRQEQKIYEREVFHIVNKAMVGLDDRERHIILNRFGLNGGSEQTLEEIGRGLRLSRERVRQLERDAKQKLRAKLIRQRDQMRYSLTG